MRASKTKDLLKARKFPKSRHSSPGVLMSGRGLDLEWEGLRPVVRRGLDLEWGGA